MGAAVDLIDKLGPPWQTFEITIYLCAHIVRRPVFTFHQRKKCGEMLFVKIVAVDTCAQRAARLAAVEQLAHDVHPLKFAERLELRTVEKLQIFLHDPVAESMEGIDGQAVRLRANERQQPLPHGHGACVRKGEAQNVGRLRIGELQNAANARCQQLRLAGARTGNHQYRPFKLIHSPPLVGVEAEERFFKQVGILLSVLCHCASLIYIERY